MRTSQHDVDVNAQPEVLVLVRSRMQAKHCKGVSEDMTTGVVKSAIGRGAKAYRILG